MRGLGVLAYAGALAVYVAAGYLLQGIVLNWIVGPLFLLIVGHVLPASWCGVRARVVRARTARSR